MYSYVGRLFVVIIFLNIVKHFLSTRNIGRGGTKKSEGNYQLPPRVNGPGDSKTFKLISLICKWF